MTAAKACDAFRHSIENLLDRETLPYDACYLLAVSWENNASGFRDEPWVTSNGTKSSMTRMRYNAAKLESAYP